MVFLFYTFVICLLSCCNMKRLFPLLLLIMNSCELFMEGFYCVCITNDTDYDLFSYFKGGYHGTPPQVGTFSVSDHMMDDLHSGFLSTHDWGKFVKDSICFFIYDSNSELEALKKEKQYLQPKDITNFISNDNLVGTLIITHSDLKKERKFHFPPREYGHVVYNPDNEHGRKLMEAGQ